MVGRSQPARSRRSGALWQWAIVVAFTVGLVSHLAVGWGFSNEIIRDLFRPSFPVAAEDVEVVAIDDDQITLRSLDGEDPELTTQGVFGLHVGGSYLELGEITATNGDRVTRRYVALRGDVPTVGAVGDVEATVFPPDPGAIGIAFEEVRYQSPLGPMDAWLIEGFRPDWVIHVHGIGQTRRQALRLVHPLERAGFHQLVISYRNDARQPADPSGYYQYGRTEWEDLAAAVELAREAGAERIVLVGYSSGADIVLSYLYQTEFGVVSAAVLDAPNLALGATVDHRFEGRRVAPGVTAPSSMIATAKLLTGFRLEVSWRGINYLDRSGQLVVPTLVFHGREDTMVPVERSRELARRRVGIVELVEVPGAGHLQSWNVDSDSYEERALAFLEEELDR